jgi:hypothetical protein
MSEGKGKEHISFELDKKDLLPPLQKKITLHLAQTQPKTINETVKAMRGQYKSYWLAFDKLEKKQVIKRIETKSYHGQEFDRFWLNSTGVLVALFEGISFELLLEKTREIYPEDKNLQIILELAPLLGVDVFKLAFLTLLEKGKLERNDLMKLVIAEMQNDLDGVETEDIISVLKTHPTAYENTKKYAKTALEKMKKLNSLFK